MNNEILKKNSITAFVMALISMTMFLLAGLIGPVGGAVIFSIGIVIFPLLLLVPLAFGISILFSIAGIITGGVALGCVKKSAGIKVNPHKAFRSIAMPLAIVNLIFNILMTILGVLSFLPIVIISLGAALIVVVPIILTILSPIITALLPLIAPLLIILAIPLLILISPLLIPLLILLAPLLIVIAPVALIGMSGGGGGIFALIIPTLMTLFDTAMGAFITSFINELINSIIASIFGGAAEEALLLLLLIL